MVEEMTPWAFGRSLIETGDLDPVYVILWEAGLPKEVLCNWLMAYFCVYHCGTACWVTAQKDYWRALSEVAASSRHPRGTERRHFRGRAAIEAVGALRVQRRTCAELIEQLGGQGKPLDASTVIERVKKWRGFGPWIAFKVADILERLALCPVRFTPEHVFSMFDSPREGAIEMGRRYGPPSGKVEMWAYGLLAQRLGNCKAPPRDDRDINIQEIETILCKWKSYLGGHYYIGKDIKEIRHGLLSYGKHAPAQELIRAGKKGGLW